jgi:predicted nucleotide-binding protein
MAEAARNMNGSPNPYNCSRPGHLFRGYERVRRRIVANSSKSYAVLGGRRCGKTSLLLKLEEDFNAQLPGAYRAAPRLLDMQAIVPRSTHDFFSAIYSAAVQNTAAQESSLPQTPQQYQTFLKSLDAARPSIETAYGANWQCVLLIDELDSAAATLPDSECFQNFRNLLTNSRYSRHYRAIATGVTGLAELITTSGSPLNNFDPEYLGVLSLDEAKELIHVGVQSDPKVEGIILATSGRHPYLLQALLEQLFESAEVDVAVRKVSRDRAATFRRWLADFGEDAREAYRCLAESPKPEHSIQEIRALSRAGTHIDDALQILGYHGVIEEGATVRLGATLFRDWFKTNFELEKKATEECPASSSPPAANEDRSKRVFVVHGRNESVRVAAFTFLRSIGLEPLEWTDIIEATGNPAPHIGEVLEKGFALAQAALVLFTPDDEARLRDEYHTPNDPDFEKSLYPQPRPNVLFEAGMAMAKFPRGTVLVQVGPIRPFSDISGIHYLRMDNSMAKRQQLAERLRMTGCKVDLDTTLWHTAGKFEMPSSTKMAAP